MAALCKINIIKLKAFVEWVLQQGEIWSVTENVTKYIYLCLLPGVVWRSIFKINDIKIIRLTETLFLLIGHHKTVASEVSL